MCGTVVRLVQVVVVHSRSTAHAIASERGGGGRDRSGRDTREAGASAVPALGPPKRKAVNQESDDGCPARHIGCHASSGRETSSAAFRAVVVIVGIRLAIGVQAGECYSEDAAPCNDFCRPMGVAEKTDDVIVCAGVVLLLYEKPRHPGRDLLLSLAAAVLHVPLFSGGACLPIRGLSVPLDTRKRFRTSCPARAPHQGVPCDLSAANGAAYSDILLNHHHPTRLPAHLVHGTDTHTLTPIEVRCVFWRLSIALSAATPPSNFRSSASVAL
ncbi:hypothetical protein MRX96_033606 [Rhipicephalus microplus]